MQSTEGASSTRKSVPPAGGVEGLTAGFRQGLVDLFYLVAGGTGGRIDVDRDLYFTIIQSLGYEPAASPASGRRHRISREIGRAETTPSMVLDLIERVFLEFKRAGFHDQYRDAVNDLLLRHSIVVELRDDGHLNPLAGADAASKGNTDLNSLGLGPGGLNQRPRALDSDSPTSLKSLIESHAELLFMNSIEEIEKTFEQETEKITAEYARRGLSQSGSHAWDLVDASIKRTEQRMHAKARSVSEALETANVAFTRDRMMQVLGAVDEIAALERQQLSERSVNILKRCGVLGPQIEAEFQERLDSRIHQTGERIARDLQLKVNELGLHQHKGVNRSPFEPAEGETFGGPSEAYSGKLSVNDVDALELKPNFFGIGLNLNHVIKRLASWWSHRKRNTAV